MVASEQLTSLLPRPDTLIAGNALSSSAIPEWTEGQRIGPFKLVRRLGKGGMGQVWLAHQLQPLIRDVALKVMLPERRSARAEAFFEVERQALAQLSHRAIAQIFDAGRLPDGALFFAMEYVPGRPLDEYLRLHPQPMKSLVRMFVELCGGIQHAHQRGLIHRDLKPQNVLVQDTEAGPLPRIIDFGIALGASADGPTQMQPNQIAGTPAYMAPEQRAPGPAGIDARCDVYALGVMLAECLRQQVGLPFDSRAPESTALRHEFARSLAARPMQGSEAAQLKRAPFELRAVVLKSLAEDREQRYASAASMAEDLQRWLQNEPVLAVSGGRGYAFRCFLRRNSLAAAAASLIGVALLGGTGLALYGLTEARAGRAQAETARALADQRRGEAEQLIQYMLGDFADKLRPLGRLDLLDSIGAEALKYLGEADIRSDAASHLARARALRTLGEVQVTRRQFTQATTMLEQAALLLDQALLEAGQNSEELHFEAGQVAFWRGDIAYRSKDFEAAEGHMLKYLAEAEAFSALTTDRVAGAQEIAYALNNLGSLLLRQDRAQEALARFQQAASIRQAMDIPASDPRSTDLVDTLSWVANAQERLGAPRDALDSHMRALSLLEKHELAAGPNARTRRFEINLRYKLAMLGKDLGIGDPVPGSIARALQLAREDAANDPSQPWRQVLLALIAYIASAEAEGQISAAHFEVAEAAHRGLERIEVSDEERFKVSGMRCYALRFDPRLGPECAATLLQQMDTTAERWESSEELQLLFAETTAASDSSTPQQLERALSGLDGLPGTSRKSLKFLIARRNLLERLPRAHNELSDVEHSIERLRRPPNTPTT